VRILSYNILKGGIGREALIASVICAADADIVMLEEAHHSASLAAVAKAAGYPYFDTQRSRSTAFMSRIPVQHHWHSAPLIHSPFLEVSPEGTNIRIWGVHLTSLLSTLTEWIRAQEIRLLLQKVNPAVPHVMTGDFNTLAPGDVFDKTALPRHLRMILALSGGDIPRNALKQLIDSGYTDAFRHLHPSENGWSLPAHQPNTRLDYAFVSSHLKNRLVNCQVLTTPEEVRQASDHLPVMVEIDV
jgi:endonuclease/exonuclease/phosphatase family metal-dependent hydrolase